MDRVTGKVDFNVDLIRALAIVLVIMLHAAIEPHPIVTQINQAEVFRWWSVDIYDSLAQPCVPLFVLLSGALLLQPSKTDEPMGVFFKKRLNRIALPFLFWGIAYFAWSYLIDNEPFTFGSILQGIQTGPYYHFWFLYMIVGLYLITPVLRVLVSHSDRRLLRYSLIVWFVGTAIVPLIGLFDNTIVDNKVFLPVGWVGYFILGAYLLKVQLKPIILYISLFTAFVWTAAGTYFMTLNVGGTNSYFFFNELGANIILASVSIFLLLRSISPINLENHVPRFNWLIHKIGQNTLPIYLFHVMVLESLQRGYLGFTISVNTLNPAFEVPLITVVTLFICLGVICLLKKVPVLNRLIG